MRELARPRVNGLEGRFCGRMNSQQQGTQSRPAGNSTCAGGTSGRRRPRAARRAACPGCCEFIRPPLRHSVRPHTRIAHVGVRKGFAGAPRRPSSPRPRILLILKTHNVMAYRSPEQLVSPSSGRIRLSGDAVPPRWLPQRRGASPPRAQPPRHRASRRSSPAPEPASSSPWPRRSTARPSALSWRK